MFDFKKDKFYKIVDIGLDSITYFKFKEIKYDMVHDYGYEIINNIYHDNIGGCFSEKNYFNFSDVIVKEINIKEYVKFLPRDHPERKVYYRKNKIKILLNI